MYRQKQAGQLLTRQGVVKSDRRVLRVLPHDSGDVSQHQTLDFGPCHVHVQEVPLGVQAATPRPAGHLLGHLLDSKETG